jgi:hypothetical protein
MATSDIPILKRPAFFNGQRLYADDLGGIHAYHLALHQLHNRALHSYGIAGGLEPTGDRGARSVTVAPGYALDCQGRDLILDEQATLDVPAVAGADDGSPQSYYLTISYLEDEAITPETRSGTCNTDGAIRRPEQPLLRWQEPASSAFRPGIDIVLASATVQNCQLAEPLSGAERRDAIPASQPVVVAGQSVVGQTTWALWPPSDDPEAQHVGIFTRVSTASAGFHTTPNYQARVAGERVFTYGDNVTAAVDGYVQIANPTPFQFDLRVILPFGALSFTPLNPPDVVLTESFMERLRSSDANAGGLGWHVVWWAVGN